MKTWGWTLKHGWSYRMGGWMQKTMFRLIARVSPKGDASKHRDGDGYTDRGWIRSMPGPIGGWTDARDMPTPPSKSFRDWWRERES